MDDDSLLLLSPAGLQNLTLKHPTVALYLHVGLGRPDEALKWALTINPRQHALVAQLFLSVGLDRECLKLPGLSNEAKLQICLVHNVWDEAAGIIEPLSAPYLAQQEQPEPAPVPSATLEAAAVKFALAADQGGNFRKALVLYRQAVALNPANYRPLVAFYANKGKFKKLESLHKKLVAAGKYEEAKYAAELLDDERFKNALSHSADVAEYAAYIRTTEKTLPAALQQKLSETVGKKYPENSPAVFV
jgi:tetratricopeptide (TPR) repeat protein